MLDEEIFVLTRHGRFGADYIESIPVYRRRHFLYLLEKEAERVEEQVNKSSNKSTPNNNLNIPQRPR